MQLRKKTHRPGYAINFAPLIDVVFLLIIFFMVVSQFSRLELEAVDLPKSQSTEAPGVLERQPLIVNISAAGSMVIAGISQSPETLQKLIRSQLSTKGHSPFKILIRADKKTPWRYVDEVMQVCGRLGVSQVKVAVIKTSDSE